MGIRSICKKCFMTSKLISNKWEGLIEYHDFRIDEETELLKLIQQHWKNILDNYHSHSKSNDSSEESKIYKLVATVIIKTIKPLLNMK